MNMVATGAYGHCEFSRQRGDLTAICCPSQWSRAIRGPGPFQLIRLRLPFHWQLIGLPPHCTGLIDLPLNPLSASCPQRPDLAGSLWAHSSSQKPGLTCPGRVGAAKRKVTVGMSRPRNISECITSIDETNRTSHGGTVTRLAGRVSSWTGVIICYGGSVAAVHPATTDVYYETRRRSGSRYWRESVGA